MARRDRRPPPPGSFVEAAGLRLHVESVGRGEPCLLLHGYLASTTIWSPVLPLVAHRVRAAAIDLPGCGYSDRPANAPYDIPWFADLIPAVLDALQMPRAVLFGHSLGGAIALQAAASHPDRVRALVLVAPLAYEPPPPPGLRLARQVPTFARWFFASPLGRLCIPALARRAAFADGRTYTPLRTTRMLEHLDAPGGWESATAIGIRAGESAPGAQLLGQVRQPALVAWGESDQVYPLGWVQQLSSDLGGDVRTLLLQLAGHNAHEEAAAPFAAAVLDWLDDLDGEGGAPAGPGPHSRGMGAHV